MSAEPSTIVDLLRHGEPVGGSKYRGQLDEPLSEKGWAQMRAAVAGHGGWQRIVSSDLSRCAEFARELATTRGLPLELDSGFREVGFGAWEGRNATELLQEEPEGIAAFWRDPVHNTPPGGEPLVQFAARVVAAWQAMVARHRGERLLLVGHAGMMRVVILHALGVGLEGFYRFDPRNASLVRIRIDSGRHGEAYHQLIFPGPER